MSIASEAANDQFHANNQFFASIQDDINNKNACI